MFSVFSVCNAYRVVSSIYARRIAVQGSQLCAGGRKGGILLLLYACIIVIKVHLMQHVA